MKFSDADIAVFEYRKGGTPNAQDIRWDRTHKGFGVRIYPTGKKVFVCSYRQGGRKTIRVLGAVGEISVAEAKRKSAELRAQARTSSPHGETMNRIAPPVIMCARLARADLRKALDQHLATLKKVTR
ncbi:Arm DNA-binding domain-containing protein [Methylocaldum sp. RMAD-M]|jgi:hypothetical protein|uniref:Arm DNA-binding domain-containing protein n=1 Tax=Methylocaldum sp. RMAD-M TaxID=2806557 RepID=UPI001AE6E749|nr:Arm DNA-binding domain-containing protein [Methylocaldum sp. RMAD-M]MBP1152714.1 hypothetical protein [Methylocaldum sp. RMAD-M]